MVKRNATNPVKVYGDFFMTDTPLDINVFQNCGMGCRYCFTGLSRENAEKRQAALGNKRKEAPDAFVKISKTVAKAFSGKYNPENLIEFLLRQKYPVLLSNNSDPFEDGAHGLDLVRLFVRMGAPVYIQTKGGVLCGPDGDKHLADLAQFREWIRLYVTITTDNDAIAAKFEPNSPSATQRMGLIERAEQAGIATVLGMSPLVPQWWEDGNKSIGRLIDAGCSSCWIDPLHFNSGQKRALRWHSDDISRTLLSLESENEFTEAYFLPILEWMNDAGMSIYLPHFPRMSAKIAELVQPPLEYMPFEQGSPCNWSLTTLLADIMARCDRPTAIYWQDVEDWMVANGLPSQRFQRSALWGIAHQRNMSFPRAAFDSLGDKVSLLDYLRLMWNLPDESILPLWFADRVGIAKDGKNLPTDDDGNLIAIYHPERPTEKGFYEISGLAELDRLVIGGE